MKVLTDCLGRKVTFFQAFLKAEVAYSSWHAGHQAVVRPAMVARESVFLQVGQAPPGFQRC